MRVGIVVAGIVLVIVGAVLLFVPVVAQGSHTLDQSSANSFYLFSVSGFSITGSIPVSISWSSPSTVVMIAAACSATCDTGNLAGLSLATGTGTSGTLTVNQPNGGEVVVGFEPTSGGSSNATATVNVTTALTTVGSILLIVGILILIVGVVLRSKSKMAPMAPPPMSPDTGSMGQAPPPSN